MSRVLHPKFNIGTDVVQIPRIERLFRKFGLRLCRKILHPDEVSFFDTLKNNKEHYLAKRFCAKEAISKAFGTGMGSALLSFSSILISKDKFGAPHAIIENKVLNNLLPTGYSFCKMSISISDDYPVAVSSALVTFYI